jgi:hypothetical protein
MCASREIDHGKAERRAEVEGPRLVFDAAEGDGASQQSSTEETLVQPDQTFALGLRETGRYGNVGREGADVGDVVIQTLQFEQDHAQSLRARGRLDASQAFDRV